ncbi:MAG: hypothetical protein L0Z62_04335 [Gemmataceae bacterium]|nr:hypothetical protein [Gemmataceae bacterium]
MNLTSSPRSPVPPDGLAGLGSVELLEENQRFLDQALLAAGGPPPWRNRKRAEARDLLALSQIATRLSVQYLDLRESLRAVLLLRVPVPRRTSLEGDLLLADHAVLGLTYPHVALREQLPGFVFFQMLAPDCVWHANVAPDPVQPLCLGARLPAGIRVKELVLMAYGALSMQSIQIDEQDSAGVLNPMAAHWWQANTARIPLSRIPFLSREDEPDPAHVTAPAAFEGTS